MGSAAEGRRRRRPARLVERPQLLRHVQGGRALGKHVATAKQSNSSELIRELADVRGAGFGLTSSPDKVEQETLAALQAAKSALQEKAPDEVQPYRDLVLGVAQSVSDAAGGGEAAESGAIEKVRSAVS